MSVNDSGEVFEFRIPGDPRYVSMVRRGIMSIACTIDIPGSVIEDIELSVSEAITNAIEHGSPRHAKNVIVVTCSIESDKLVVDVRDEGLWSEPVTHDADVLQERGRGLRLINRLMDSMTVSRTSKGSTVRMVKKVGSSAGREAVRA